MSGLPPNILVACGFWAFTFVIVGHAFWSWERVNDLPPIAKAGIISGVVFVFGATMWTSVADQFRRQYAAPTFVFLSPQFLVEREWTYRVELRGYDVLSNVDIIFWDNDAQRYWNTRPQAERVGQPWARQMHFAEIGPTSNQWSVFVNDAPYNLENSDLYIIATYRGGRVDQELKIVRVGQEWRYAMTAREGPRGRILVECKDPDFPDISGDHRTRPPCVPNTFRSGPVG